MGPGLFGLLRRLPGWAHAERRALLCLVNVSGVPQNAYVTLDDGAARAWTDLLTGKQHAFEYGALTPTLARYQVLWLAAADPAEAPLPPSDETQVHTPD